MLINAAGAKDIQRVKLFRHDGAGQVGGHAAAFPENMSVRMRNLVAVFRPGLTRQAFFMPKNPPTLPLGIWLDNSCFLVGFTQPYSYPLHLKLIVDTLHQLQDRLPPLGLLSSLQV